jgi:hypothetical protein
MALQYIAIWGFTALVASALAIVVAKVKNRDYSFWAAWSFVLPPMVLVLALLPRRAGPAPARRPLGHDDDIDN